MKYFALFSGLALVLVTLNSCCFGCARSKRVGVAGCEKEYVEVTETEWVEQEAYLDPGPKGGQVIPTTVKRPVQKTVKKRVRCSDCGSFYCSKGGCCDIVSTSVLRRATVQGGSGEPHMGMIPTMKVLAP